MERAFLRLAMTIFFTKHEGVRPYKITQAKWSEGGIFEYLFKVWLWVGLLV